VDVMKSCNRFEIVEVDWALAFARLPLCLLPRGMFVRWTRHGVAEARHNWTLAGLLVGSSLN